MAGGNTSCTRGTAIAVVAAALALLLAADAGASQCSRENRVDHRDAECLSASWQNRGIFKKSTYRVQNMCPLYGQVVAKVDLVMARDRTAYLNTGRARRGWAWRHIRSISCCSDKGICNRADAVTDEGCVARFKQVSSAPLFRRTAAPMRCSGARRSPGWPRTTMAMDCNSSAWKRASATASRLSAAASQRHRKSSLVCPTPGGTTPWAGG